MHKNFQFPILLMLMIFSILFLPLMAAFGMSGHPEPVLPQMDKVETSLLEQIADRGTADYVVELGEKADLSAAETIPDWDERGRFVLDALKATAERTQAPVLAYLNENGLAHQSFFAGNEVMVFGGGRASIDALAALPAVAYIRSPKTIILEPEVPEPVGDPPGNQVNSLAWGIADTGADDFWSAFSFQGEGIVVANIDTGVQWDHPALDQAFKCGTNPSDPACWEDPSNICPGGSACDNHGHGTHTMGTMVADDDPALTYQAGMAPGAKWIACKGCESNSCSEFALNSCADWILAPAGNPSNRPHIVNNSWGGGSGDDWYKVKVSAWRAAGIFPAFSAGNGGPSCGSNGSPGDYQESFASGAYASGGTIADLSGRGPSVFGHEPYTKPNISAPGMSICSTVPTNAWSCGFSGTSMASPHTAGAVALLWSCNPALIGNLAATFDLLQGFAGAAPAGNCGAPPDGEGNYTYGYGYLDVYSAGSVTCSTGPTGTLRGHVYDTASQPLKGATVTAAFSTTTNVNGFYSMEIPVGTYAVSASKEGYSYEEVVGVKIIEGKVTIQDFELTYIGTWQDGPNACFDWTRFDTEFFPATGLIYALGGRSDSGTTDGSIFAYNPETGDCFDTGTDLPNPVSNYTVNLVNDGKKDILCVLGGRASGGGATRDVQCYNPISNTASVVASLPAVYSEYFPGATAVLRNKVYIFGGMRSTSIPYNFAQTYRYNPVTRTFTRLGDLTLARGYIFPAVVDGKIYAFGGTTYDTSGLTAQTRTEVMANPEGAGTWNNAAVAELPEAFGEGQAFGFDSDSQLEKVAGKAILFGGGQWPGNSTNVWAYDPSSNTYKLDFPDLQYPRRNHAGVFVSADSANPADGLPGLWVFGGYATGDDPPFAPVEYFSLSYRVVEEYKIYLPAIMK